MSENPVRLSDFVIKHGSHNQASHAGGKGGAAAEGGGAGGDAPQTPNQKKMDAALNDAKKNGASESLTSSIKDAHQSRDVDTLEGLEAGIFEGFAGRHGSSVNPAMYQAAHTAVVHALRDVTGKGKSMYPKISEMG